MGQTRPVIAATCIGLALIAPFIFPLLITIFLGLIAGAFYSLAPFVVGVIVDALYWQPSTYPLPLATVIGLAVSLIAFFVRRFVKASIMQG